MVKVKSYLPSVDEIAKATSADLIGRGVDPTSVQIDSRHCEPRSLFVPLAGENTDGHLFIPSAVENGSSLCFVNRQYFLNHKEVFSLLAENHTVGFLVVDDCLTSLQNLARHHMRTMDKLTVIGITGSNGKTTTKEIVGAVLSRFDNTFINPGNYNSEIGLPLAVLGIGPEHRYAVLELGMNRAGEMDILVEIAQPRIAAVTNIGIAHVGLLGN